MVKKINESKAKKEELLRRIQTAEQNKKKTESIVQKLVVKYQIGELSYSQYNEEVKRVFQTKTPEQWVNYYDKYIQQSQTLLEKLNEQSKKRAVKKIALIFLPILAVIILSAIFLSSPQTKLFFSPEENETIPNQTIEEQIPSLEENITVPEPTVEENATAPEPSLEENITIPEKNITEINITIPEAIPNQTTEKQPEENISLPESIPEQKIQPNTTAIQYKAVINRPVKWIKTIDVKDPSQNLTVEIPLQSQDISIKTGEEVNQAFAQKEQYEKSITQADRKEFLEPQIQFSPQAEKQSFLKKILLILAKIFSVFTKSSVTGSAIYEDEIQNNTIQTETEKVIDLKNLVESGEKEIAVEYTTEAPQAVEQEIPNGKKITITGPDEIHYQDVLAYTELPNIIPVTQQNKMRLYRTTEGREQVQFTAYDLDEDKFIDYIEWTVPYLSEQIYEIIFITKAEHLDSNRTFIEDIYEQVKSQDNNWTSAIPSAHYVRVTFEQKLDSTKDITIFPRIISGSPRIEIYEINSNELIAEFASINSDEYNKVLLTSLQNQQDTFDLKILDGEIQIDYIVDPVNTSDTTSPNISFVGDTPVNNSTQRTGSIIVNVSSADDNGEHYVLNDFDKSLAGWWRMDDLNSFGDIVDLSIWSNNGTKGGDAAQTNEGKFGKGFSFDGSGDYITTENAPYPFSISAFTWAMWIYPESEGGIINYYSELDSYDCGMHSIYLDGNNKLNFLSGLGEPQYDGTSRITSTQNIPLNEWTLITFVYVPSSEAMSLYINGVFDKTEPLFDMVASCGATETGNFYIGEAGIYDSSWSTAYFNGIIDDVSLFNRTLSVSEISALYEASTNKYYNEFTSLQGRNHTFKAYAVDTAGNLNSTEQRFVTINKSSVFECDTLSESNTTYEMNANIINNGLTAPCITISAQNITLDCKGYSIKSTNPVAGVYSNQPNTTVKNCNITMGIASSGRGIYLQGADYSFIFNNSISRQYTGMYFNGVDYTVVKNNRMYSNVHKAIWTDNSQNNNFSGNIIMNDAYGAFWLSGSPNNLIENTITNNRIYIYSNNITLKNVTGISPGGIWSYVNGTNVIDSSIAGYYLTGTISVKKSEYGEVYFYQDVTGSNSNLSNDIRIENNSVTVESLITPGLNRTANITLYNSPGANFKGPTILRDGMPCTDCYAFTPLNADTVIFNVTSWSNYSIGEDPIAPNISFVGDTPANNSLLSTNSFVVNVSSADDNGEHYVLNDFDKSLVGWWRMDDIDGTKIIDLSNKSNNGTAMGNSAQTPNGKFGKAFEFYGNGDYVGLGTGLDILSNVSSATLSAWVYPKKIHSTEGNVIVAISINSVLPTKSTRASIEVGNTDDIKVAARAIDGGGLLSFQTNGAVENKWQHIVGTINYATGNISIYLDGQIIGSSIVEFGQQRTPATTSTSNSIGSEDDGSRYYFNGSIDEVLIFNRILSADEIATLYSASAHQYYNTFTNLPEGAHTFKSYAVDLAGNLNSTEQRTVTTPDVTAPNISFVGDTPANASARNTNSIIINVSSADNNGEHYVLNDFDKSLVGWWRLDNDSSVKENDTFVYDWSGNENNGTVVIVDSSKIGPVKEGKFGGGFEFLGMNNVIRIGNPKQSLTSSPQFTYSAWIKRAVDDTTEDQIFNSGGRQFYVLNRRLVAQMSGNYLAGATTLQPGVWYHATFTYENSRQTLYLDGIEDGTSNNLITEGYGFLIGRCGGSDHQHEFNGILDELMVFNRSLSGPEIQSLYNATKYQYYNEFTELPERAHTFKAYAVDAIGNLNSTEQRTVTILPPCIPITQCDQGASQITLPNRCYYLANDIQTTGTCLTIEADNITLNGNKYAIKGDSSGTDYGIYATGRVNIIILNTTISDFGSIYNSAGIYFESVNNSAIQSVNVSNNLDGIYLSSSSSNNTLIDVTANDNYFFGLYFHSSSNNTLSNITANNNYDGIYFVGSSNNFLADITANDNSLFGMYIYFSPNNTFTNITANNNYDGINVDHSANNLFSQGRIESSSLNAIYMSGSSTEDDSSKNVFKNISVTGAFSKDIVLSSSSALENTTLIDMILKKYSFAGNKVIFEDTNEGKIRFLEGISGEGNELSREVNIRHNRISIDAEANSGLGKSARISLYNYPAVNLTSPFQILRNGRNCTDCTNIQPETFNETTENINFTIPASPGYSVYKIGKETDPFILRVRNLNPVDFAEKNIAEEDVEVNFQVDVVASPSAVLFAGFTLDRTEQTVRAGSCNFETDMTDYLVYTCTVFMKYWDEPAIDWNVHLMLSENSVSDEYFEQFEVLPFYSFEILPPQSLNWQNVVSGQTTPVPSESPLQVRNTGNIELNSLSIEAFNLRYDLAQSENIPADSFSAKSETTACDVEDDTVLAHSSVQSVQSFQLLPTGPPSPTITEKDIYFCLNQVPSGLPAESFSTSPSVGGTAWEIDIYFALALVVIPRRKKKKSKKEILELVEEKLKKQKEEILELVEERLKEEYQAAREEIKIPAEIFAQGISPAEALTKYLKENQNLSYSQIAQLLNRNQRTIWINYRNASIKKQSKFQISAKAIFISIKIFSNRNLSISESLVANLRNSGMTNSAVANLLNKDSRNIYTIFKRALQKRNI